MKKYWWVAWVLCLATGLILFVGVALGEVSKGPSADWSRKITVDQVSGLTAYAAGGQRYLSVVAPDRNNEGYVLRAHKGLTVQTFKMDGTLSAIKKVQGDFSDPDRFYGRQGATGFEVTALSGGKITHYSLREDHGNYMLKPLRQEPQKAIKDFVLSGTHLLYWTDEGVGLSDGTYQAMAVESATFLTADGSQIAVIRSDGAKRVLESYSTENLDKPMQRYTLNGGSRVVYDKMTAYDGKSSIGRGIFVEMRDSGSAISVLMNYGFNGGSEIREIADGNHIMQPLALTRKDGSVALISTQIQKKGNQGLENIQSGEFDGKKLSKLRFLTRSDNGNLAVSYVEGMKNEALFSIERRGSAETISMSGSDGHLISKARPLTAEDYQSVLFNCMLTMPMALFSGLIPFLDIVFPTAVVLGIVSCFKMNLMEYHFKKVIAGALLLHISIKGYYCYTTIVANPSLTNIKMVMPVYLNTPLVMTLTVSASTLLALAITKWRYGEWRQSDYFGTYMTFAVVDMSIFTCLVMPYYASYLTLPIFY